MAFIKLIWQMKKVHWKGSAVGTFFSIRNPQNAMRTFGIFISQID